MVLRGRSCLRNRAEAERGRACCLCCYAAGSRGRTIVCLSFCRVFALIRANHSGGYYTAKTEGNSRWNPLRSEGKEREQGGRGGPVGWCHPSPSPLGCLFSFFLFRWCVCVSLVRVVIICPASTHTALVSSPSLTVLHSPSYIHTYVGVFSCGSRLGGSRGICVSANARQSRAR